MRRSMLEQGVSDVLWLKGATILGVREIEAEDEYDIDCLELEIRLSSTGTSLLRDKEIVPTVAWVRIWQDPEGNGPGFLALVATGH